MTGHLFEVPGPRQSDADQVDLDLAAETWRRLVPAMAAGRAMRVSRDGRNFPRRGQRTVTPQLPNQPAALLIYDAQGRAPVLCLDLDVKRGPVEKDLSTITGHLDQAGCRWFSDHSPTGGRHIYVPLAEPVPFHDARAVTGALAGLATSLDVQPMSNLLAGCIRPPGARHRTGGHQVLDGTIGAAVAALSDPTDPHAWRRLNHALEIHGPPAVPTTPPVPIKAKPATDAEAEALEQLDPLQGHTAPDAGFQHTARTGEYDTSRYATPSEARQGVVWAATAAGWSFTQLVRRLEDGTWPGLASFYSRYSPAHRHRAIANDWRNATRFEKRRREAAGGRTVRARTTSSHKTQPGAPRGIPGGRRLNQEVRVWLAAVELLHGPDADPALRLVLTALAEAAARTDSLVVEHGNRSLAIATGLDQSTVGRCLNKLLDEPADRSLVDLVRTARGVRAHTYQLTIPPLLRPACEARPWRRGRIHALRPAFRELGRPAAFVYAALEQLDDPAGGRDLAAHARIGVTATYEALTLLAAWGLATRTDRGWTLGPANLAQLAEAWGITDAVRAQITRYRIERAAWHAWLIDHGLLVPNASFSTQPSAPPPRSEPPPQDASLFELLAHVLGAHPVDDHVA